MNSLLPILDEFLESEATRQRDRDLDPLNSRFEREIAQAFKLQGAELTSELRQYSSRFPIEESIAEREWTRAFRRVVIRTRNAFLTPFRKFAPAAIVRGARGVIQDVRMDLAFLKSNQEAARWIGAHGGTLIRHIDETTLDRIRPIFERSARERWSYQKLEKEIIDQFAGYGLLRDGKVPRARLIAHNEMRTAWEEGRRIVAGELMAGGIEMEAKWTTVGDSRVTPQCRANSKAGWISARETFPSGHLAPPRFPGCRCHSVYRRER